VSIGRTVRVNRIWVDHPPVSAATTVLTVATDYAPRAANVIPSSAVELHMTERPNFLCFDGGMYVLYECPLCFVPVLSHRQDDHWMWHEYQGDA
jgi:hypothetical protein